MRPQKEAFLASEGDAWLARNESALRACDWAQDPVCSRIATLFPAGQRARLLEIGCGEGSRLHYLSDTYAHQVCGVDPSQQAVARASERGVPATRATADNLPFGDASFDVVIFGFCLYLCDDGDLFQIAHEADRVLASPGWLMILDFDARAPVYRSYRHLAGLYSRKMDYKSMYLWHPAYSLASYQKFSHGTQRWTDEPDEWVSLACLRKHRGGQ
jgi:ubiquinone/menaquinone biosynthesis C-methylase UbiE